MRIGLIGCGGIARRVHLPNLLRLGVEVAALADLDPAAREQAARQVPAATLHDDWRALLETQQLDGVLICSPPACHTEQTLAFLEAGKPVYLEKPLADTLAGARRIVEAARTSRAPLMVGFNLRFHPLTEQLRRLWFRLGALRAVCSVFTAGSAVETWRAGAGPLLELGCHHVDLTRFCTGEELELVQLEQSELQATVTMRTATGVPFQGFYSLDCASDEAIQVYGSDGHLSMHRSRSLEVSFHPRRGDGIRRRQLASLLRLPSQLRYLWQQQRSAGYDPSYRACLQHFLAVCRGSELGEAAGPEDGWQAIRHFLPSA